MIRKEDGSLHFFVNSTDLGCAAHGVPADVYGVVDLFGQCAQVTIVSGTQENGEVDLTNSLNGKNPGNYNLNPYAFKVAKKECKIYEIK